MLVVHRSERADLLADALGRLLADPLDDPVVAEVVAVPTRGVERWLAQRLSQHLGTGQGATDGVCANIEHPFPGTLVTQITAGCCATDPASDPWSPERCVWPLVEIVDGHLDEPWLKPLADHLKAATPAALDGRPAPLRRLPALRHVADLFDRYAVHRPELVLSWAAGEGDHWQAALWRLLRSSLGSPSPAERLGLAAARIAEEPQVLALPRRLSLFGLTRLPAAHVQVLEAVAGARDVHLFMLHPSGVSWERIASAAPRGVVARALDGSADLVEHPLLRSWGRDSREMQIVLSAHGAPAGRHYPVAPTGGGGGGEGATLLRRLQDGIRSDRPPPGRSAARPGLDPSDSSVQVHACHGRARQVEVLRDAILHLLADDPGLEARDVIVMCPDIEAFAPLVQAAFEPGDAAEPVLRVRLADRAVRQTNPLLAVAGRLLDLAGSRVSGPEVVDLASCPPVRLRFGFDQSELSLIESWVAGTGVRWGIDARQRASWGLGGLEENTWAAGLDRLMLGVAMNDEGCRMFGSTLPYGDLPAGSVDLAGRLAELVERLGAVLASLAGSQPASAWVQALAGGTEVLAEGEPGEPWQHQELRSTLAEVAEQAGSSRAPLCREEVAALLASRLQGRPTRANFRTGDLTVCTLVPMRSVPHKVVALLGLDDGAFPRHPDDDADDLLLAEPRTGERDARSEDRQLMLDAVLAATEKLVITYSGRDERTNRRRPPCAAVAELLDLVDATVEGTGGEPASGQVVVHHPLQPFDPRNFAGGALGRSGPWSHDRVSLAGAEASMHQHPVPPWLAAPLPALDEAVLQLDDLVRFAEHPVRAFLRRRLGLYVPRAGDDLGDAIPVELDGLEKWAVGDRLLAARLSGTDGPAAEAAERARGLLPPGALADPVITAVRDGVDELLAAVAAAGCGTTPAGSADVRVDLPGGRTVVGTVAGVFGSTIVRCVYSRLAAKHRLAAWVRFLALAAARPDEPVSSLTAGRGQGRQAVAVSRLAPLTGVEAARYLAAFLELYDQGMRQPLPLPCATALAWADVRCRGGSREEAFRLAGQAWDGSDMVPGERDDADHVRVWGSQRSLSSLMVAHPSPGGAEPSLFGALAARLWAPLLGHETLGAGGS